MNRRALQDILPWVEMPSRYLGTEINRIQKMNEEISLRVALAFPDLYEIGTSHFGIQILYNILNNRADTAAERVYAPGIDFAQRLKSLGLPLGSLETNRPLNRFDIVGFSLLYELNYTNIVYMLDLGNIPLIFEERREKDPIVIAGGPCCGNPEPAAELFDAMVVGDGEEVILEMVEKWMQWKKEGDGRRRSLLESWHAVEGVYVPAFFKTRIDENGFQRIVGENEMRTRRIKRRIVADLDKASFPTAPVVPFGRPVHDRLRLEIARGCSRGCRFCQAGMIYRPVRERSRDTLLEYASSGLESTGYDELSLLSLSTGDYCGIEELMCRLMTHCAPERIAVSLPSLRAGSLTPPLMELIKMVRKTGFTIAPEAGSQRMRNVINKRITQSDIEKTVNDAFQLGWQTVKLYFMIGLPGETQTDIEALGDLVETLQRLAPRRKKGGMLNVSVATFVPKPHTPFQWADQLPLADAVERISWIKRRLQPLGVHVKWQNPQVSLMEGLWARGDRRLSGLLRHAFEKGCVFDGWTDRFSFDRWMEAIDEAGVNLEFYTTRKRDVYEPLPWDHIDTGVSKEFLRQERQSALRETTLSDCRSGECHGCGVCDFDRIKPIVHANPIECERPNAHVETNDGRLWKKVGILFTKKGDARFFGHIELMNILVKALRRAGVSMMFSEGFHPKPKISFEDALPIGMESENEVFYIRVSNEEDTKTIQKRLQEQFPEGMEIIDCLPAGEIKRDRLSKTVEYTVRLKKGSFSDRCIEAFENAAHFEITKRNKKGKLKTVDLKRMLYNLDKVARGEIRFGITGDGGANIRPSEVLRVVFSMSEEEIKGTEIIKRLSVRK